MAITKYSDFIQDDGSFEKILKYLEEIEQKLLLMAKSNKESVLKIPAQDLKALAEANKEYVKMKAQIENLQKQMKRLKATRVEITEETIRNTQIQEENKLKMQQLRKEAKAAAKAALGLTTEYQKQSKTLRDMKNRYKDMVLAGEGATDQAKDLKKEIIKLDKELRELDKSVGDSYREIGKYEEAITKAAAATGKMGLKAGAAALALTGLNDIIQSNQVASELYRKITGKLAATFSVFKNAVATAFVDLATFTEEVYNGEKSISQITEAFENTGSEIENFSDNVKEATDAADDAVEAQIRFERATLKLSKAAAVLSVEIDKLNSLAGDSTKTFDEIQEASEAALQKEVERAKIEKQQINEEIKILQDRIKARGEGANVLDLEAELAQKRIELTERQGELDVANLELNKQIAENNRDRFERELDFAIDVFDTTKSLNERRLADETKTADERANILERTRQLADSSFASQTSLVEDYTKQYINFNELVKEEDEKTVRARLKQYALDDVTLGRVLEIIKERRLVLLDLADAEKDIAKQREEANKTDFGAQDRATKLARLRTEQEREALAQQELQQEGLKNAVFETEEARADFIKQQEAETLEARKQAIQEFIQELEGQAATIEPLKEQFGTKELKDEYDNVITETQRLKTELAVINAGIQKGAQDAMIEAAKKAAEDVKKLKEELNELLSDALDASIEQQQKRVEKAEKAIDKQGELVERQRKRAEQGLANSLKAEQEALAGREKRLAAEQRKLERREKAKAIYAAYAAKSSAGDAEALTDVLKDFAIIETFIKGFKDGGYTGDKGVDEAAGVVHGREFVFTAAATAKLGLRGMSNDEGLAHIENMILDRSLLEMNAIPAFSFGSPKGVVIDNSDVVAGLKRVEKELKNFEPIGFDLIETYDKAINMVETKRRGNVTSRRVKRFK